MRAPGAATGMTLFEIAIDEMAYAAGSTRCDFRLLNYSDKRQMNDKPFTSQGAARSLRGRAPSASAGPSASPSRAR